MLEITDLNAIEQPDEESILVVRKEPNTRLPEKYTEDSVSFDFIADAAFLMQPKSRKNIMTGVKFLFSSKAYGYISGKVDLTLQGVDCIETIINAEPDDDEVTIMLHNRSNMPIFIERGEKIIIFVKNAAQVNATSILGEPLKTERGALGFGSTGNR
uniref:dUTPase-like domain-containing protein n=2 Tax=Tetranychus urticae TaxID=32264 RepID=T1KMD6_TETUR